MQAKDVFPQLVILILQAAKVGFHRLELLDFLLELCDVTLLSLPECSLFEGQYTCHALNDGKVRMNSPEQPGSGQRVCWLTIHA